MQNKPEVQQKKPQGKLTEDLNNQIDKNNNLQKQPKQNAGREMELGGNNYDANNSQENAQNNQYYQYPNYQQYPPYEQFQHHPWNSQFQHRGGHHGHGHRGPWGGHHHRHHGKHGHYNNHHGFYQQNYQNPIPPNYGFPIPPRFPHPNDMPPFSNQFPPYHPPFPAQFPPMQNSQLQDSQSARYKAKEQCYKYKKHDHKGKHWRKKSHKKYSHSKSKDSSSSSSSNDQRKKIKKQFHKQDEMISQFYKKQMNDFLESRQVNQPQREKIVKVLSNRFPLKDAPILKILQYLQFMQKQNLVFRMSYVKLIKIMIRFQFDLSQAIPKIQKIQSQKIKKFEADQQYNQTYGQKEQTPLLDVNDLILNNNNVLYLVDGNNILPTNKHFRKFFQSKHIMQKIIAQIRCQWYFSHAFNPQEIILFFDQKFQSKDYEYAKKQTFFKAQQQQRCNGVKVIYGDGTKADNKIIEKLQQLSTKTEQKSQIILISADRDLIMRCQQIKPILHTSGRFFFKYAKYKINRKYKGYKQMKHLTKQIMHYAQFY